jgi:hypothetical protein
MKIKLKVEKEFEVRLLLVNAGVRYWEDAKVDGMQDEEGTLIPCVDRDNGNWCPLIDIETGIIQNWDKGTVASVHYKVCDDGTYALMTADKEVIKSVEGYVPSCLCIGENGYGDYIIMDIDENGKIADWEMDFDYFTSEED